MKRPAYPSHRTYSPDARGQRSPLELRRLWADAAGLARGLAGTALDAEAAEASAQAAFGQNLTRMMIALRDLKPENFPAEAWSARVLAGCFLGLARAFSDRAAGPEARAGFAPVLKAAAVAVDDLLSRLRTDAARSWRAQTGERDED